MEGVLGRGEMDMGWKVVLDKGETGRLRRRIEEVELSCSAPLTVSRWLSSGVRLLLMVLGK